MLVVLMTLLISLFSMNTVVFLVRPTRVISIFVFNLSIIQML
jgi:hypothetical protein